MGKAYNNAGQGETFYVKAFKRNRVFRNLVAVVLLVFMIGTFALGVYLVDSILITFVCSCFVGICCSYVTGWTLSYFTDRQSLLLLDMNNKIEEIDRLLEECRFETNLFSFGDSPRKLNLFDFDEINHRDYFQILCRMGGVFREIAISEAKDFSAIEVDFYLNDTDSEKVIIGNFNDRVGRYCAETGPTFSKEQINRMFMNAMLVSSELRKARKELVDERNIVILGGRKRV